MSARVVRRLAVIVLAQLALVGLAVAPRLSAHLVGEEYRLRVAAYDPIDPFRGAYVELDYPDLHGRHQEQDTTPGDVYLPLVRDGRVWRGSGPVTTRPADGPYLACTSDGWRIHCGIESWFADQDEAVRVGERLGRDGGVATVRVDGRGHAALVGLDTDPARPAS
jgi:uncharacterized membrane-anchored protein